MKYLLIGTALLAVALGAGWYGGETWLSGKARDMIQQAPQLNAASVAPLRDPKRIGLHLAEVEIGDADNGLSAPDLEVYAPMTSPNTMVLDLPRQMQLRVGAVPIDLGLDSGQARATLAPLHEMAVRHAQIVAQGVSVDGTGLAEALTIEATLAHMGAAAPKGSRAAYAIATDLEGMALADLDARLNISGPVQIWLSELPGKPMLEGRVPPAQLTGLQTPGLQMTLGEGIAARLIGRVQADAEGFAEGELAIYTADAEALIEAAVQAGLLPQNAALLAGTLLKNLSDARVAADQSATEAEAEAEAGDPALSPAEAQAANMDGGEPNGDLIVSLPPAAEGEIRLPLILRDGKARLGIIPIGPA